MRRPWYWPRNVCLHVQTLASSPAPRLIVVQGSRKEDLVFVGCACGKNHHQMVSRSTIIYQPECPVWLVFFRNIWGEPEQAPHRRVDRERLLYYYIYMWPSFRKRVNFLIQQLTKNHYHLTCCVTLSRTFTLRILFAVERVESLYNYSRKGQLSVCQYSLAEPSLTTINHIPGRSKLLSGSRLCSITGHSLVIPCRAVPWLLCHVRHERDSCHCSSLLSMSLIMFVFNLQECTTAMLKVSHSAYLCMKMFTQLYTACSGSPTNVLHSARLFFHR